MTNLLLDLELDELSLVDRPANQAATICLIKRDNTMSLEERKAYYMDKGMSEDEAQKKAKEDMEKSEDAPADEPEVSKTEDASEAPTEADELLAEVDAAKAENDRLLKALEDNGFVVTDEAITKAEEPEYYEFGDEKIVKSDIPAPILKALEEVELEKRQIALRKQAEEILPNFDVEIAASILAHVAKDDAIVEALKSADAAIGASMQEIGEAAVEGDLLGADAKLDALVKSHMDENGIAKKDRAIAYAAVAKTDEGKSLIKELYKGE